MIGLREQLHHALAAIEPHSCCALLNFPAYANIGDHLIWLGEVDYLHNVRHMPVTYACDYANFSETAMLSRIGKGPVLLTGGGNLGDLWPVLQHFNELIVARFVKHKIYILPQAVYFQSPEQLRQTAAIFNSHPDLTIFIRDAVSYEIARRHFHRCNIILCPDIALQLDLGSLTRYRIHHDKPWLLLTRKDQERRQDLAQYIKVLPPNQLQRQDWVSFERHWLFGSPRLPLSRTVAGFYREWVQRGIMMPRQAQNRRAWLNNSPEWAWVKDTAHQQQTCFSLSMLYDGFQQIRGRAGVITDRLHAHLLAHLAGVPSVLTANSYHKNEAFHNTWGNYFTRGQFAHPEHLAEKLCLLQCAVK